MKCLKCCQTRTGAFPRAGSPRLAEDDTDSCKGYGDRKARRSRSNQSENIEAPLSRSWKNHAPNRAREPRDAVEQLDRQRRLST